MSIGSILLLMDPEGKKPELRLVVNNDDGELEPASSAGKRILGLAGNDESVDTEKTPTDVGTTAERGDRLLDTVVGITERIRPVYEQDETIERFNLLFFQLGHMAHTTQPNLEHYLLGDQSYEAGVGESINIVTKRKFARLYDAFATLSDELLPESAHNLRALPKEYPSRVWEDPQAASILSDGLKLSRTIVRDLGAIYQMPRGELIEEIKRILLREGMGISLPGPQVDNLKQKAFEKEVINSVFDAWRDWHGQIGESESGGDDVPV